MATVNDLSDPKVTRAVDSYFATLGGTDERDWLELFADDAVVHDPVGSLPSEGREQILEIWRMLHVSLENLELVAEPMIQGGSGAAVKWRGSGQGVGGGRRVNFEGISVFEISRDGRIQTLMTYWDPAAMLIELAGE